MSCDTIAGYHTHHNACALTLRDCMRHLSAHGVLNAHERNAHKVIFRRLVRPCIIIVHVVCIGNADGAQTCEEYYCVDKIKTKTR